MGLENRTIDLCENHVMKVEAEYLDELVIKLENERDCKVRAKLQAQLSREMRRLFPNTKPKQK